MTDIAAGANKIQVEEVNYRSSISEATFNKMGGAINYILENASDYVGQLECTMLSEADFATIKNYDYTETDLTVKKWVIVDGQNVTGSDYATLTGITTLPAMKTNQAFPRQSDSDANIGAYQANQNASHDHTVLALLSTPAAGNVEDGAAGTNVSSGVATTSSSGGAESRPNAVKINYFLRINS